jgi:hypothetical protein
MTNAIGKPDYRVRRPTDKPVRAGVHAGNAATVAFLQLLGRAARQFHTYPAGSPLCTEAVDACHRAFTALEIDHTLTIRVSASTIVLGDDEIVGDALIEQELARPLHRARVASVEIDRGASPRDWSLFCAALAAAAHPSRSSAGFAERLLDAGVASIVPRVTPRPEVLELGAPPPAVRALVDRERARQAAAAPAGPAQHLYPPDKGWVRIDPASADATISLTDLTVLVEEPADLAAMLSRLIDDQAGDRAEGAALQQRYDDVVMLIGAVDPRLARVLFSKLAHAVLRLDADSRRTLLRGAILPSLLDGRLSGEAVLGEFPDVDLADALSLLLDLEAAAPELLPVALDRLRLPADRRTALAPLISAKLDARRDAAPADQPPPPSTTFDDQARALTRVDASIARNLAEFTAFDLSINASTAAALTAVHDAVVFADGADAQIACALSLSRVEPNPAVVTAVVGRALPALRALVRAQRWQDVTRWLARAAEIDAHLEALRPDVARALHDALAPFCNRALVVDLAQLCGSEEGQAYASTIAAALGAPLAVAWLDAVDDPADRARVRPLSAAICHTARPAAPAVLALLPKLGADAIRSALTVLGSAGAGYEKTIADHIDGDDERTTREALRALARAGTEKAAALIVRRIEDGPAAVQAAAEEALWRLPPAAALAKTRELLGRREFVTRHPQAATRLLERAGQSGDDRLKPVLEQLSSLRLHFWSPALARVGAKARELLQ